MGGEEVRGGSSSSFARVCGASSGSPPPANDDETAVEVEVNENHPLDLRGW